MNKTDRGGMHINGCQSIQEAKKVSDLILEMDSLDPAPVDIKTGGSNGQLVDLKFKFPPNVTAYEVKKQLRSLWNNQLRDSLVVDSELSAWFYCDGS